MPPPVYVHFAHLGASEAYEGRVPSDLLCPHHIVYRGVNSGQLPVLNKWEPFISRFLEPLATQLSAVRPPSFYQGAGLINMEVAASWRTQLRSLLRRRDDALVERTIQERLDLIAHLARDIWDREIAFIGPEDSPFCLFRAPMLYCTRTKGILHLPDSSIYRYEPKRESLIPLVTNRVYDPSLPSGFFQATSLHTEAMARAIYELNSGLDWSPGLNRGVICWSEDKTPEDQQTFFDWVSLLNKELLTLESTSQ